jgi:dihydroorotate dehydrogenase electron transfer subunit
VRQFEVQIAEVASAGGSVWLECTGPDPGAAPGQPLLALSSRPGQPVLRVPIFPMPAPAQRTGFYVPAAHSYARLAPGEALDVLGPVGKGFRLPFQGGGLLVIASGLERVMPVITAGLARGLSVAVLAPRGTELLPAAVEIQRGPLDAELARWADVVALDVADPHARAQHIRSLAPGRVRDFVQALMPTVLPCGVGACQACWVQTGHTPRLACVDGPVLGL